MAKEAVQVNNAGILPTLVKDADGTSAVHILVDLCCIC